MPKSKHLSIPYVDALKKELEVAPRPRLTQIAVDFITRVGGPKQFATRLADEFNACEPGSLASQRICHMIFMCLKQDDNTYDPTAFDSVELEDLMNIHKTLYAKVNDGTGDAQEAEAAEGAEAVSDSQDGNRQRSQDKQVRNKKRVGAEAPGEGEDQEQAEAEGRSGEDASPERSDEDGPAAEVEEAEYRFI